MDENDTNSMEEETPSYDQAKILVLGAGGLGCEILKNLALLGFKDVSVIDMDTIDVTNLNRQFLFRDSDVGRPKAEVAAEFVNRRVPDIKVTPYFAKLQDYDEDFYSEFQIVISGLDSIEARRWINSTLFSIAQANFVFPFIDGGTEGFKGQARVMLLNYGDGACFECSLDMYPKKVTYPVCTIANTPRLPEHCIEWASVLEWPKVFGDKKADNDDPEDVSWIHKTALKRAEEFSIPGVTYSLTQGVIKNIIPAIASTNAIIAASCCTEAYKIALSGLTTLDNYMTYSGNEGVYSYTFPLEKRPECPVCGSEPMKIEIDPGMILEDFIELLKEDPMILVKRPSIRAEGKTLRMMAPPQLEEATRNNLSQRMDQLVESGDQIVVTDSTLPNQLKIDLRFI